MTRKALVTGGSGGIGSAIAERLAADGMQVWIHYRSNPGRAQQVADRINAEGGSAYIIGFDVTDATQCQQAMDTLLSGEETIDVIIHNAGITADAPFPAWKRRNGTRSSTPACTGSIT